MGMIKSFKCNDTAKLFTDRDVKRFRGILRKTRIKLEILHATVSLDGLKVPPGNRLEALKGDRKGQYSIRIDSQLRICFKWEDGNSYEVESVAYHWGKMTMAKKLSPITPGEILLEEFLEPMGISQAKLARDIKVPANRINQIINGKREITTDTALRLGKYFGIEPEFWLNLQMRFNMKIVNEKAGKQIERDVKQYTPLPII
jgi:addiction module HigA family antidote